ncbi:hypothetical protein [Actinacidiphila sp. ITFR-21]|uniref:hypothetical protein n=1 Tax=Actinacidiphila sp. ITFR-21 TaxID=3075199 RepID=UPI00288A85BD|nr:hypothetical protein [Streptomyces sp. ITFR-21]WNI16188.1 hypothetical protein RLT57_12025 [Streptomyces sp. ITFR-21]
MAAVVAAAGVSAVTTAPAHASPPLNVYVGNNCGMYPQDCDGNDMVGGGLYLFYHSRTGSAQFPTGSNAVFYGDVYNYASDTGQVGERTYVYHYEFFAGKGEGSGEPVKNNAAAAVSCSTVTRDDYRIYYNSGYTGHSQEFDAAYYCLDAPAINLDSTLTNENASQHWA